VFSMKGSFILKASNLEELIGKVGEEFLSSVFSGLRCSEHGQGLDI
jgi:hypothetical protein